MERSKSPVPLHDNLFPASAKPQYSHLPSPRSPARLVLGVPSTPEYMYRGNSSPECHPLSLHKLEQGPGSPHPQDISLGLQQCLTPELTPYAHISQASTHPESPTTPTLPHPNSCGASPTSLPSFQLGASASGLVAALPILSFSSTPKSDDLHCGLSSPFMTSLAVPELSSNSAVAPVQVDDVFSPSKPTQRTETSSSLPGSAETVISRGEMSRTRQEMIEQRLAQTREAETRRPDYLKRAKRTLSEVDPPASGQDESSKDRDRGATIGIMESPHKGRRLALFQATSDESFEESLMAGGYGRYRTADWVRQPQPLALAAAAGPSNVADLMAEIEEKPPSEKELRKKKRLAAFRAQSSKARLCAVELEGRGRVLIDMSPDEEPLLDIPALSPKKRGGNRRRKKGSVVEKGNSAGGTTASLSIDGAKPNWPDTEFPWRLRTEERAMFAKVEEEAKMRWIERFLDRDTDEEASDDDTQGQERSLGSTRYAGDDRCLFPRLGGGKIGSMLGDAEHIHDVLAKRRDMLARDPADARVALLCKKSVRALSYSQQKRQRGFDDDNEEVLCICNGTDDGRELVQCDGCQTWYHLSCIGIHRISELGREEDPWFCERCAVSRYPSPPVHREPTFVPTDDGPSPRQPYDAPFFQAASQDSPGWDPSLAPRTPPREAQRGISELDPDFTSSSSWVGSSRHGPSTPQHQQQSPGARVYTYPSSGWPTSTYEEHPFDPTSTPSRGLKFGMSFVTPKDNLWFAPPHHSLYETPSKESRGISSNLFGGALGSASHTLDAEDGSARHEFPHRHPASDDSPVLRKSSRRRRRSMEQHYPYSSHVANDSDASPLMSKGKEMVKEG